jgi:hypothetical protein
MDRYAKTKKGMNIQQKTRVKVAGLINDLHLLQSLPGDCTKVSKNYKIGVEFLKYLKELDIIKYDRVLKVVMYTNYKNHSIEYILDYVMSRYQAEYKYQSKKDTPSDLVTCEVELPAHMKGIAQDAIYKNEIRNLQSDLNRSEARIATLEFAIRKKAEEIAELKKKKSIFARIKNLFQ